MGGRIRRYPDQFVHAPQGDIEHRSFVAREVADHGRDERHEDLELGRQRARGSRARERQGVEPGLARSRLDVEAAELGGQAAIVAERIDREDPYALEHAADDLGARGHRLARAGLPKNDGVVRRPGEAVEHDWRSGRAGPAVQVTRGLVQVARDVEKARGEARAIEVPLGDGRRIRAGDDAVPGVGKLEGRDLGLKAEATHLQTQHVQALGEGGEIGSAHQEDRVDEVHAAGSGVDGPAPARARLQDALALDVGELAPLGSETLGGPNLAQTHGQEAHRLGPRQRPHSHRDRVDARQREHRGSPAGLDLGRPAPTKRDERERLRAFDDVGADVVLGAFAREQRRRLAELVLGDWRAAGSRALRPCGARAPRLWRPSSR